MRLSLLLAAISLHAQIPKPLELKRPVRDKNFYLLTLMDAMPEAIIGNPVLARIREAKLAALEKADANCKTDVPCHLNSLRWSEDEIDAIGKALPASPLAAKARESGVFVRYAALPDGDLIAKAWKDAALGMNHILDVYGEGKAPRYPAIDSIAHDPKSQRMSFRVGFMTAMLVEKKNSWKLFYEPTQELAMMLLELNWRDEAGRHEPLERGENKAAYEEVSRIDFKRFPYSAIVVPGAGGDRLTVRMDPVAVWRAQLAAERHRQGLAPFILVSGGYVHPAQTPYAEAIEMKRVLVDQFGIPAAAVIIDPHARHTTTNIRNAARLIFRYGIPFDKPVLITTDQSQSAGIESPAAAERCLRELGYLPLKILKRVGRFDLAAQLLIESLQADAIEPLDP